MWWRKTIKLSVLLVNRSGLSKIQFLFWLLIFYPVFLTPSETTEAIPASSSMSPVFSFFNRLVSWQFPAENHHLYYHFLSRVLPSMSTPWKGSSDCFLCGQKICNVLKPTSNILSGGIWRYHHLGWVFHFDFSSESFSGWHIQFFCCEHGSWTFELLLGMQLRHLQEDNDQFVWEAFVFKYSFRMKTMELKICSETSNTTNAQIHNHCGEPRILEKIVLFFCLLKSSHVFGRMSVPRQSNKNVCPIQMVDWLETVQAQSYFAPTRVPHFSKLVEALLLQDQFDFPWHCSDRQFTCFAEKHWWEFLRNCDLGILPKSKYR